MLTLKNLAPAMLKNDPDQTEFANFHLPFSGGLKSSNRWVKLAGMMPWEEVERCYAESLSGAAMGAPAKSGRIAYGALLIRERLGLTDEETAEQVQENPYLQYFLGLEEFRDGPLFDPSMMAHFRSRFTGERHRRINERIIREATVAKDDDERPDPEDADGPPPSGKLLVDATCAPADVKHPTDLGLLDQAREKTEGVVDTFHETLRRDLGHIDRMLDERPELLSSLSGYEYKCLLVIRTLYQQQSQMHAARSHRAADRIVSIAQPHVRPIVRGKAGRSVEFGAKLSIGHQKSGYVTVDTLSWDAYNEGGQIESCKARFGHYPASVHADGIYLTRANRKYCKERGIRLSGKPLGRPRKAIAANLDDLRAQSRQRRQDAVDRIPVEGKFGNAKRKGTLDRVMPKLAHASESAIHVAIVVMNLDTWLRAILFWLFRAACAIAGVPLARLGRSLTAHTCNGYSYAPRNWPASEFDKHAIGLFQEALNSCKTRLNSISTPSLNL